MNRFFSRSLTAPLLGLTVLSGCKGLQAPLDPAGPQARQISGVWWLYFWVTLVVYAIVMGVAGLIALRNRRRRGGGRSEPVAEAPTTAPDPAGERRAGWTVGVSIAITTVLLFVLMLSDFFSGRAIHAMANAPDALTIRVTGHQWWWEVRYGEESRPQEMFTTANEIHLPVGRPVQVLLNSSDVIHSFWVPNLHGKKDMIPGHGATVWIKGDRPGTYFGQCAEFCGLQHAQMRLVVVVESAEQFEAWQASQRRPANPPATARQTQGQHVFLGGTCALCHTIAGTPAGSRVGPDLTHFASRATLAAGSLPNTTGHLAGWILDPQKIKPGAKMPPNPLNPDDLHALLEYLSTLK